ncbi:hypothetical protein MHB42_08660 [Lysinibacillus sp. FSL K6-0232]|uniref:hypothetical protein n=1 Tax=Lysinibacillus sp. FSL K6-0232 TaxID=2921425 RepID=UPI0030FD1F76
MKKLFIMFITVVFFASVQMLTPAKAAASTVSAFEASKLVFNEHFVAGNHLGTDHSTSHYMRLAIDIGFLSVYTSQAKNKNDATYATALAKLNQAIDTLYTDVSSNANNYANNAFQDPGTAQIFTASILVKKFNMSDLTATRQTRVNYLYNNTKSWLNNTYNNKLVNNMTQTFRQVVESQTTNASGDAPFSVNIVALYGGALALDSDFLFKQYGVNQPTDYPFRNNIANIGNYIKAINFGNYTTEGRLSHVGSVRNYVDAGYISWHGKGLALMAHGTVYTPSFATRPSSVFMTEADAIAKGFQTVYSKHNYIPEQFYGFGSSVKVSTNRSQWLYPLTWTGSQQTVNWLDAINRPSGSYSGPVIVAVARQDTQALHRAIEGLTGAMLKGLYFNQ